MNNWEHEDWLHDCIIKFRKEIVIFSTRCNKQTFIIEPIS